MPGRAYFAIAHAEAGAGAHKRLKELEAKRAGLQKLVETRRAEKTWLERKAGAPKRLKELEAKRAGLQKLVETRREEKTSIERMLEDKVKAHREAQSLLLLWRTRFRR
jgi:hypothetical protein